MARRQRREFLRRTTLKIETVWANTKVAEISCSQLLNYSPKGRMGVPDWNKTVSKIKKMTILHMWVLRIAVFYLLQFELHSSSIRLSEEASLILVKWSTSCSVMSDSAIPWTQARLAPLPWNSPGKNTGVGCPFLLQGIFLTQGSNLGLLHCRQILYHLGHQGSLSFFDVKKD